MLKQIKKNNQGFTIIEVLIVLAIAGLILLIVFLAVPALQRNQRNTARKNDVSRVGGAVTEFVSNNNGTVPDVTKTADVINSIGKLSQYDFVTIPANLKIANGGTPVAISNVNQVRIVSGVQCDTSGAVKAATSSRQLAIQWASENTNGDQTTSATPVCTNI